jgi:hypothetical protein
LVELKRELPLRKAPYHLPEHFSKLMLRSLADIWR